MLVTSIGRSANIDLRLEIVESVGEPRVSLRWISMLILGESDWRVVRERNLSNLRLLASSIRVGGEGCLGFFSFEASAPQAKRLEQFRSGVGGASLYDIFVVCCDLCSPLVSSPGEKSAHEVAVGDVDCRPFFSFLRRYRSRSNGR
jgi:hypothetical protein